jgi:filamentous hemagglutinin family protein
MMGHMYKLLLATTALVPLGLAIAIANPQGPQVVGGSATVQGQGTPTVTVTQTTNSAIINWNTFNIGVGERTNIIQPGSSSVQLDRVTGGLGPSQILGSLWSNGHVFLVNPDGILFGQGATVNAAGFLATTNDITNANFMAGKYNFSISGLPDASIVNQGTITASSGGFAALVAPGVRNSGTISATLGTVALAAGNAFTLDFYGDRLITLGVNDSIAATVRDVATGQPLDALVKNEGTLKAAGGRVELTAAAARMVVDSVINTTGVIEADTIGQHNGMIVISAATADSKPAGAPSQTVKISGKLSAAGKAAGTKGGTIQVTGENIAVTGATLDASGRSGGGTVLIGGDVGGGNPSSAVASILQAQLQPYAVATASNVTVDAATTINASALDTGDGGKVVVWSNGSTSFNGSILARGGANSGNGGFVETSGHEQLNFTGARVDTSAPYGQTGSWLLDPAASAPDLTIDLAAASTIGLSLANTDITIQTTASGTSAPPGNVSSGNGDIIVASSISWNSAHSLTLSAYRNVDVNANITNTSGAAAVNLRADNTGTGNGTVSFGESVHISTAGAVSIFYNPSVNPFGSVVNNTSYVSPTENFTGDVTGGGTFAAYMLVNTVYDLQNIQNNLSGTYSLGRNIDASATASWNGGTGFVPITGSGFTGLLDGHGWTIDQLTIHPTANNIWQIGLFGQIGTGGVVQNLNLTSVDIQANPSLGTGSQNLGSLAGQNDGVISNVTASGKINGFSINGLSIAGVTAGGLVGQNGQFGSTVTGGTIQNSSASVKVTLGDGFACNNNSCTGPQNWAGGLAGSNAGSIDASSASGNVIVGSNGTAGGLVGQNGNWTANNNSNNTPIAGASIVNSSASGTVSSAGVDVQIGGLVGQNMPLSPITNSRATGNVSATGTLPPNQDCSNNTNCQYINAGGLVGQNFGTISGPSWVTPLSKATAPTACIDGYTCYSGTVSVSSQAQGGGLAGSNDGIISNAFAIATVTGDAGPAGTIGQNNSNQTGLGGLVDRNSGQIINSFATGTVGSAGKANLSVGGLVDQNSGTISGSFANVAVSAGNNSTAGGLVNSNNPSGCTNGCNGGLVGDGDNNTAAISTSNAYGNVTVGTSSVVGGLVALTGRHEDNNGNGSGPGGSVSSSNAYGAVSAGDNSIVGGLVGIVDIGGAISSSFAHNTLVASTGVNSIVGGLIGFNAGSVTTSGSTAPVSAVGNSYVGGLIGVNVGSVSSSQVDPQITAGDNSIIGGIVGLNVGSIASTTAVVTITSGSGATVGGVAGIEGTYTNTNFTSIILSPTISSFPVGTIANSTTTGSGFSLQVGTSTPATPPAVPTWLSSCTVQLCTILTGGTLQTAPTSGVVNYSVADVFSTYGTVATVGAVTLTGAPNGVTATVTVFSGITPITLTANTPAGTYTEIVTALNNPSYTIASSGNTNGTLTINPATLLYVANPASIAFGNAIPALTGSVTGFVNSDTQASATTGTLVFSTLATPSSNVGSYAINGSGLTVTSANYVSVIGQAPANATAFTIVGSITSPTPLPLPLPPPISQITPPVNNVVTTPPVILVNLTPPSTPAGSPPAGTGASSPATPGKSGFTPPPLPARSVPGPNGETRSFIPPIGETRLIRNQLILQFGNLSPAQIENLARTLGLQIISSETILGRTLYTVQISAGRNLWELFGILDSTSNVSAAPMYTYKEAQIAGAMSKGDPGQYMLGTLHLNEAHAIATGKGVTIALIDSEVDKRHSELQGAISEELDTLGVKEPLRSHATEMAGAIVSHDRLLGVAPGAKILSVRAFGEANSTVQGTTLSILKGIEWAMSHGANIINMSFVGPRDPSLERAFKAAHDKGIVLIAAAGNAGPKSPPLYPGADPNVIAVTATDVRDRIFIGANQGPQLSVAAPGVEILAPAPEGGYKTSTGTSIATAHVSGVVALMLERDPALKPDDVRKILESTATDLGQKGKDNQFGWGLVNPPKALEMVAAQMKPSDASTKSR